MINESVTESDDPVSIELSVLEQGINELRHTNDLLGSSILKTIAKANNIVNYISDNELKV